MKKVNYKFWTALIMISILLYSHQGYAQGTGENILVNGGFEENGEHGLPGGWQIMPNHGGRGKAVMDDRKVHSGNFSLKLEPNRKNTPEGFGVFMKLNPEAVKGREVTISGYARLDGMGRNPAGILFKTDRANWLIIPQAVQNEFFFFSKTFTIADSIPEAFLFFIAGGTKGSAWLDDLSLSITRRGSPSKNTKIMEPLNLKFSSDKYVNRINTPGWQDSAFISPDGKELYFAYMPYTRKDHMDILVGRISEKDVKIKGPIRPGSYNTMNFETYKAEKNKNGTWGKPVNINIKGTYSFYAAKVSFDGTELYYVIRDYPGSYGSGDIFVSKKLSDGNWSPPEDLGPNINTESNEETPCISADGNTLYFARNKGDALGFEIMVSRRVNNKWTIAEKMPYPINEPRPEKTANHQPFITADGKEFYFTRIQQLYKSTKRTDGRWGKPVKVFPNLPLSGHASVTADGKYLYFLTATDKESLKRENWSIWYSERKNNGNWSDPRSVD